MKFLSKSDTSRYDILPSVEGGEYSTFTENLATTFDYTKALETGTAERRMQEEAFGPLYNKMKESFAEDWQFQNYISQTVDVQDEEGNDITGLDKYLKRVYDFAQEDEQFAEFVTNSGYDVNQFGTFRSQLNQKALDLAEEQDKKYREVTRKQTASGVFGEFTGKMLGHLSEPVELATLVAGAPVKAPLLAKIAVESAINVGVEALQYPAVRAWQNKVTGEDYSPEEFLKNAGIIAVGTGALVTTIDAATKIPLSRYLNSIETSIRRKLTPKERLEALDAFRQSAAEKYNYEHIKDKDLEVIENIDSANEILRGKNYIDNDANDTQHDEKILRTLNAILRNDYSAMPQPQTLNVKAPDTINEFEDQAGFVEVFTVSDLNLDETRFQFRTGTQEVPKVKAWDPVNSGQLIIFRDKNGKNIVVDGHTRYKIAKKLSKKDPNIELRGIVLREEDGFTPEMARMSGMIKNYYEGTVAQLDKKAFKQLPELADMLRLFAPDVIRTQNIARLATGPIMAMYRGVVDADVASLIGKHVADEQEQLAMMDILVKEGMTDLDEIEDVIIKSVNDKVLGTINPQDFSLSLRALEVPGERDALMNTLIRQIEQENDNIASEMAKLAANKKGKNSQEYMINQKRKLDNEKTIELIKTQGNATGEISDEFTKAALEYRRFGGDIEAFAARTGDAFRTRVTKGDFDGIQGSRDVLYSDAAAKASASTQALQRIAADLKEYNDPFGPVLKRDVDNMIDVLNSRVNQDPTFLDKELIEIDAAGNKVSTGTVRQLMNEVNETREIVDALQTCRMLNG